MRNVIPLDYPKRKFRIPFPIWVWQLLALIFSWWLFSSAIYGTYCFFLKVWP